MNNNQPLWNEGYKQRDKILLEMGYKSYKAYLASPLWKAIRSAILERSAMICEVCHKEKATQVHHRSYVKDALIGNRPDFLVAVCRPCHEEAEFDFDRKTAPKEANQRMSKKVRGIGKVLFGLCKLCKRNPTGQKGKMPYCGRCMRDYPLATGTPK